jgi:hypothetical protein
MKTWEIDGRAGSQKEYAKKQIAVTAALLKEYGTCDPSAIGKIKADRAKRKEEIKTVVPPVCYEKRQCTECGEWFFAKSIPCGRFTTVCSDECKAARNRRLQRECKERRKNNEHEKNRCSNQEDHGGGE